MIFAIPFSRIWRSNGRSLLLWFCIRNRSCRNRISCIPKYRIRILRWSSPFSERLSIRISYKLEARSYRSTSFPNIGVPNFGAFVHRIREIRILSVIAFRAYDAIEPIVIRHFLYIRSLVSATASMQSHLLHHLAFRLNGLSNSSSPNFAFLLYSRCLLLYFFPLTCPYFIPCVFGYSPSSLKELRE